MSNASEGLRFEMNFCRLLADAGFWVHRFEQNKGGQQPADVIAMKGGSVWLFDCKVCADSRFRFSRMEPNQRMAMDRWIKCGGTDPKFALKDAADRIWILEYKTALTYEQSGKVSVPCQQGTIPMNDWIAWWTT